ncbi:tetratricopeptide repeat protein [Simiduia agarivorans]|uniref:tetratricopeptide repeat protein n=1 Tax=Simiduia agarivorans TaxID=447471 RepID=UPI0003180FBA|nr:tetratricopeptide repeat protein [Simiduia agarivorans]
MARLIIAFVLLWMVGCASAPEPALPPETEPAAEPAPVAPAPAKAPTQNAVTAYARSADAAFQQGDYRRAISLAERGLRSNRYAADLYLLLAQAYDALGNRDQARNFARLGLRYSGSDETLTAQLQQFAQP